MKYLLDFKSCLIFLSLLTILLCLNQAALSQPIPFETIDKGEVSYFRYGDPEFTGSEMVIKDPKTWAWFWKRHAQGIQPIPPLPKVDFRTEMVIVAILGYQTSGGGPDIEITSIECIFNCFTCTVPLRSIKVSVKENREQGPLDVITNPYHIVKTLKSVSVLFEHETMDNTCSDSSECGENQFCLFPEGKCSGHGICTTKPGACPLYYAPVCGCDMNTYGNECEAYANGVSIMHKGECEEVTE